MFALEYKRPIPTWESALVPCAYRWLIPKRRPGGKKEGERGGPSGKRAEVLPLAAVRS